MDTRLKRWLLFALVFALSLPAVMPAPALAAKPAGGGGSTGTVVSHITDAMVPRDVASTVTFALWNRKSGTYKTVAVVDAPLGTCTYQAAPGSYQITYAAVAAGEYTPQTKALTVVGGQTYTMDVALVPTKGMLSGTVYTAEGAALPGAQVAVYTSPGGAFVVSRVTDSSGRYSLTLSPGTYTVAFSMMGYGSQTRQVTIVAGVVSSQNAVLSPLPVTGQVFGVVRDGPSGMPLSGVSVVAESVYGVFSTEAAASALTDVNGSYSMELEQGSYTITFSKPGWVSRTETVTVAGGSMNVLDMVLGPEPPTYGTLNGMVFGETTATVLAGAQVDLALLTSPGVYTPMATLFTDSGGHWLYTPADPGDWRVTVSSPGRVTQVMVYPLQAGRTYYCYAFLPLAP